ncbi:hypothetical protein F2Y36_13010 [Bacteroides caccae]|uniref:Major fimbrial subunit protein N-terminal domain-containing protein n=1 Tax=Bacteroides caccae TaxID=47678 RepID=A0A6L3KRK0_9BACE|nr:hypothetical protein [Bacteroides caccae]KAA5444043.1 hypothetical protein F2Y45_11245 [Bacteroides caccae]KAA5462807.1 hypothetical protein F2Y36_13010 [Bacteroides caccae]
MKEILRHIVWMTILVSWALLSASCRGGEVSYTDEVQPDDDTAILVLRTGLLDQTRASDRVNDAVDNSVEYMYTLRIVILHENGTVEHNMYIDFGEIPQTECYRIFKVTRNETKKIYLIANEENASTDLHEQLETLTTGNTTFASIVDNFVFIPDYKNPIPMSSVYDVPVKAENLVEREFYLVRAATKFAFRFTNKRKSKVSIDAIHISDIAGATYLIPHKREPLFMSFDDESLYWINWLKKVADESQQSPDDVELADKRGWIQAYDIPSETSHQEVTVNGPLEVPSMTGDQPGKAVFPVFYLPESKKLKAGLATYGEQEYTLKLDMSENGKELSFTKTFPNLKALFRNTHVLVDITFTEKDEVKVQVVPYAEVILEPEFGLKPETKN